MLAHLTSKGFVCLRCQLTLPRPTSLWFRSYPTSRATFSSSARHSQGVKDALSVIEEHPKRSTRTRRKSHKPAKPAQKARSLSQFDEPAPTTEHSHIAGKLSPRPIAKVLHQRGYVIRSEKAPIGIKRLGDDAEILVLRGIEDAITPVGDSNPVVVEEEDKSKSRFKAMIEEESVELDQEEINKQLDSLRLQHGLVLDEDTYIAQSEYVKLSGFLSHGFTVAQLMQYYAFKTGIENERVPDVLQGLIKSSEDDNKHAQRSPWRAGVTSLHSRLPSVAQMRKSKRLNKTQLVNQIIRQVWRLVTVEEIEAAGELEITLKRYELLILAAGDSDTVLDRIQRHRNVKIEIYHPDNVLRITADKVSAEYAAGDIEKVLAAVVTDKFSLTEWLPFLDKYDPPVKKISQAFSQGDLQMVQGLTGALIQESTSSKLIIRAPTSEQVDDAKRQLLSLLRLKPNITRSIQTTVPEEALQKGYMGSTLFPGSLDYRFRRLPLGRWSFPLLKQDEQTGKIPTLFDHETASVKNIQNVVRELTNFEQPSFDGQDTPKPHHAVWKRSVETEISAQFGQALFPLDNTSPWFDPTSPEAQNAPPIFTSAVPGLPKFLFDMKWVDHGKLNVSQTLIYRFVPSPAHYSEGKTVKRVIPNLSIHVTLGSDGKVEISRIDLTTKEHYVDVLIPDSTTDVRFKRIQTISLQNPELDPAIRKFCDAVRKIIYSGARLTAPPTLEVNIPAWTIRGPISTPSSSPHSPKLAKYIFIGVEHRQSAEVPFQGYWLRYTRQQGGKLVGKEGLLELKYGVLRKEGENLDSVEDYVKKSFRVIERINYAAASNRTLEKWRSIGNKPRHSGEGWRYDIVADTSKDSKQKTFVDVGKGAPVEAEKEGEVKMDNKDGQGNEVDEQNMRIEDEDFDDSRINSFLSEDSRDETPDVQVTKSDE